MLPIDYAGQFFIFGQIPDYAQTGTYIPLLVLLSYIIASLGSFTGLRLATDIQREENPKQQKELHIAGSFAFGAGIWSMHFIGMLAYDMEMVHTYDPVLTVLSIGIAVGIAYGVLQIIRNSRLNIPRLILSAVLLGMAICTMHYMGMAAMVMDAELVYVPGLFLLSVVIAITASAAALCIVFMLGKHDGRDKTVWQMFAALIMGAAICGMHYTGVEASVFLPYADCLYDPDQNFTTLGIIVAVLSGTIFVVALTLSLYGQTTGDKSGSSSGQSVFMKLSLLLGVFLLLIVGSFIFFRVLVSDQKHNSDLLNGVGLQRMMMVRYAHHTSVAHEAYVTGDKEKFEKNAQKAKIEQGYIETNYRAFLLGGALVKTANGELSDSVPAFQDEIIRQKLELAQSTWQEFVLRSTISLEDDYALLHPDSFMRDTQNKTLMEHLDFTLMAHGDAIAEMKDIFKRHKHDIVVKEEIILGLGILTFILALFYARFFIYNPLERSRRELQENRDNLEKIVEEQTRDLVNAQKDLVEQKGFLNTLIENLPMVLLAKDVRKNYEYMIINKQAEDFYGMSAEEMLGTTDHDHFPKEEADFFAKMDRKAIEGGELVKIDQEPVTTKTKGTFIAQTYKMPIFNAEGEPIILLVILQDVTDDIRQKVELQVAKELAETASQAKSDFLANMSHEIRTPMNAVLGMSNLLLDTPLDKEQHEWSKSINTAGETLLNIINDIIDISKIESGRLTLEKASFDLFEVIQEVTSLYAYQVREKGVEMLLDVSIDVPRFYIGDPVRLKQILSNLLSNALKFTSEGYVMITLSILESTTNDMNIEFRIQDSGIGVPPNKQDTIFEKFSQAEESTTRKFGGTGLGLNIVSELIDLMGGSIGIESKEGEGSTFIFNVHLGIDDKAELKKLKIDVDAQKSLDGINVLIVDDCLFVQKILSETLTRGNINHDVVSSAEEALALLQSDNAKTYDLCLLDHSLEEMTGLEMVEVLRKDEKFNSLIVIVVSGTLDEETSAGLKELGLQGYIEKPFHYEHILGSIRAAVQNMRNGGEAALITRQNITGTLLDSNAKVSNLRNQYPEARVLIVEDMKMNMMLIKKVMSKFGVQLDTATNGREAYEACQENEYDMIFMDCQMPEMDGFEATEKIRSFEEKAKRPNVPIVALTADAMIGDRDKCLASGMNDYINKPFKESEIAEALDRWMVLSD